MELISLTEYATIHNKNIATIRRKIIAGNLKATKIGRNWTIEKNEPYIDMRKKINK